MSVLESASRVDGGIFEAELALQRQLAQFSGVEVDVVALRDEFTDADAPRWLPLKPQVGEVMGPRGFGFSPGLDEAMTSSVDVGYCAALWKYPAWAFLDWQKRTEKPAVVAPHGSLDAWALQNSKWKKRIAAAIFKDRQLRNATCFRALCSAEADSIRAYGLKQRIEIVPNGVELVEVLTTEDTEGTEGKKRLLFLGRIHPKKGLIGALRAWADSQNSKSGIKNFKDWQLVIAGWDQGGHEGELRALCSELGLTVMQRSKHVPCSATAQEAEGADVVFYGPAFRQEKEQLLRRADAFVLPSLSEGLPMSVLEAWAYGLPVVMTPECHLPEGFASQAALEIRNGKTGDSKWSGLQQLLDMSDSDRIEMGRRGRRLVEEKFTWPKVAAQMKALYEEILGG
ncbi:MAG: glycosyltransferase [Verrucomicrobia bacterium]|nr:glycosyltransferase [Verrucomicrobiota bacterium]